MIIVKTLTSLLSRSSVFDAMLDKNMRESQVGEVDILDMEPETLKQMLEFIYTGQVLGFLSYVYVKLAVVSFSCPTRLFTEEYFEGARWKVH